MTSNTPQPPSLDNVDYSPTQENETGTAVQTILTGRKCWRIMKGKDEAVWPPALEAALIEGLDNYKPAESRSTRALGRFPMRNKFVSDYIFQKTGKRRTPKQVGSRIQQLRDTSSGKQILKSFSDRHYEMMRPSRSHESSPSSPRPRSELSSPTSTNTPTTSAYSHVYIQVLPPSASVTSPSHPTDFLSREDFRALGPRPLRNIDPTVTFMALNHISCYSDFVVRKDGIPVHKETAPVDWAPTPSTSATTPPSFLCRTTLVPKFWPHLCEYEDPSAYTITHDIRAHRDTSPVSGPDVILSVLYHFIDGNSPYRSWSPESVGESIESDTRSLSAIPSPDLGSEFDMDMLLEGSPPVSSLGFEDMLLMPDLIHSEEEGYLSLPPSPSVISFPAGTEWTYAPKLGCDNVLSSEARENFFHTVPGMSTDPFFDTESYF